MLSPPGVDVDRFDWDDFPRSGPPRILYVGSIDPGRGVRVLVRAMASIVREVDARLVLAGSMAPKFDQALKDGIRELGLQDKVDVLGPVDHDQLPTLLATATVCVVPAAADLTPNPTVVYPTKLLEYMACRCAIVAPRRDTVTQVVENNHEALLFEPGDPIDLARKVLRLLGEPALRDKISQNAYERVRRDFTASAARRALRAAYNVLAERFADQLEDDDDAPKVEMLSDDDFEATVFEEAPVADKVDTAVSSILPLDDDGTGHTSSESVAAPPPPREVDETMERAPVPPGPRDAATGAWTTLAPVVQAGQDDWVVTNVAAAVRSLEGALDEAEAESPSARDKDDGTPIEGVIAAAPALPLVEGTFVAGEIDVPTPPPERVTPAPSVDFTAASSLLGPAEPSEPDTGSRTPPIERR